MLDCRFQIPIQPRTADPMGYLGTTVLQRGGTQGEHASRGDHNMPSCYWYAAFTPTLLNVAKLEQGPNGSKVGPFVKRSYTYA